MGVAQPLNNRNQLVNSDGTATEYFIRWAQQFSGQAASSTDVATLQSRQITAGFGLSGGGDLSANRTLSLGNPALTDPNANRGLFWNDAAGKLDWLTFGSGLSLSGTTLTATGGGGSARTVFGKFTGQGNTSATWQAGYVGALQVMLLPGESISKVGFFAVSASASTNWRVGIYSDTAGAMGTLQVQQTTLTNGVVRGWNEGTLDTPYVNSSGALQAIWIALVTNTANFTICSDGGAHQTRNWNNAGSTFPATAPAQSVGGLGWMLGARA